MTNLISCKNLSLALLFVTGGAWAAADKYWIAENGAGNWGDANWATSTDGVGSAFDSGKTALFHQPLNNIDLFGGSFTAWTLRPKSGEYSTDNRCVVNICNTSETEATLTFKDFGDKAEDLRNMVVTFGGSKSTGKVKVYGDADGANGRNSFILDHDSHLVFAANSEYTESNALTSYIGKTAGNSNSVTVENGASVKLNGDLYIAYSGSTGTLTVNGGTFEVAHNKWLRLYANGVINLNGGTFKTQHIQHQNGATINFNGGTLQANAASSSGLVNYGLKVYFGERGGTIDNGGFNISIAADMGNSGTVRFAGSGVTTLTGDNLYGNDTVVEGGSVIVSGRDTEITKSLTVSGGIFETDVDKWTNLSGSKINLNGGIFKTRHIHKSSGSPSVNFNGGTLRATRDYADNGGLIQNGVTVNVNSGILDCGGYAIVVGADLGGSGSLTLTGGNTIALNGNVNYSGKTFVAPGTTLDVYQFDASNNILNNGLVITGVPEVGQKILTLTRGEGYTFEHADSAWIAGKRPTCPIAPETEFELDETKTSIVVKSVGPVLPGWYIGPADGSLSDAANWSDGAVPTSGNPVIFCTQGAHLSVGATFRADTITIPSFSEIVTIVEGKLQVNTLTNASKLAIAEGAKLMVENDIVVSANNGVFLYGNEGTVTVGGKARAYHPVSGTLNTYQYQTVTVSTKPICARGIAYDNSGSGLYMRISSAGSKAGMWVVGEDGLSFTAGRAANYTTFIAQYANVTLHSSANWALDNSGINSTIKGDLCTWGNGGGSITINTSDYNEPDNLSKRHTVTLKGRLNADNNVTIAGCGTVVVDTTGSHGSLTETEQNTFIASGKVLAVTDTATLKVNAGKKILGDGTISLGAGTTLAFESAGSSFATPDIVPVALPAEGKAIIRIDGTRMKSGDHVLATIASGSTENVIHDPESAAIDGRRASLRVENGKLILTVQPSGLMVIIR